MIAIITDSTCDIPADVLADHDIGVVHALINIDQQSLRDGIDLTRESFYTLLPTLPALPTTSAPGPAVFAELYERALARASHVVSIHASSKLSGIYNAARLAARQIAPDRIHLVDSGLLSMGVGWPVLAAASAARNGESLEGVLHSVQDTLSRIRVYAVFNTVEYLARSGRINMVQAGLTGLLNIKPLVELRDGVVSTIARVRTWSRAVDALARFVRNIGPLEHLAVMHSNCVECAHDVMGRVRSLALHPDRSLITSVTTVIGTHVGPHAVGVAAIAAGRSRPSG